MNTLKTTNIVLGSITAGLCFLKAGPYIAGISTGIALSVVIMWTLYFLIGD